MPKVSWSAFLERHPAAHLIVGVLPEDEAATSNARPQLNLMSALVARLAPKASERSCSTPRHAEVSLPP
jgi:hypothetical protein